MNGLQLVLSASWTLVLQTPLCIRSGYHSSFKPTGSGAKTRSVNMDFAWNAPPTQAGEVQVSDLHFGLQCVNGHLIPQYLIPAQSVRGALRSWSILRLVPVEERSLFVSEDEGKHETGSPEPPSPILPTRISSFLLKTFGMAAGEETTLSPLAQAGSLRVQTGPLKEPPGVSPGLQGAGWAAEARGSSRAGPENACRHITVRGPVDRITQAAKDGGLHYFLEFSPGQQFAVNLQIANAATVHLDLMQCWARELDYGMLRLGGLSSIGRGRVGLVHTSYALRGKTGTNLQAWEPFIQEEQRDLDGIWRTYGLRAEKADFAGLAALLKNP